MPLYHHPISIPLILPLLISCITSLLLFADIINSPNQWQVGNESIIHVVGMSILHHPSFPKDHTTYAGAPRPPSRANVHNRLMSSMDARTGVISNRCT